MNKKLKIMSLAVLLLSTFASALADRGIGKRSKTAIVKLNITAPTTLKASLNYNLRNGLKFTGSFTNNFKTLNGGNYKVTYSTFHKGSYTYIVPSRQKIVMPNYKVGYAGLTLVIKKK
jgi:hypothetical protein